MSDEPRADSARTRPERPPWQSFKDALAAADFRPSRRFGQNFLLDDNMARAIASDAEVEPGRFVLEIGPGCGFLSVHLAHAGAELFAVEVDPKLVPIVTKFLAPYPGADVLECDVLSSKSAFAPAVLERLPADAPWTLCSNLPYSISGPALGITAQLDHPPQRVVCLVQKEVAERLASSPADGDWGPLSAAFCEAYDVRLGRSVPPQLFWPRPKVDSAVFIATLRSDLAAPELRRARIAFSRRLLGQRRKTVRRVLGDVYGGERADAALAEVSIDPKRRAETLGIDELRALHGVLGE